MNVSEVPEQRDECMTLMLDVGHGPICDLNISMS